MNFASAPLGDPFGTWFGGGPPPGPVGFGFGPAPQLRARHQEHRRTRRQLHDPLGCDDAGGPGAFGAFGFGPGGPGFGRGRGPGHGHGRPGPRHHRGRRGDVRTAILALLAEQPMHGYQMIQEIAERSLNLWRPSPGSVYPTLQLLVDEGLVVSTESEGSKRLFELTEEGRAAAEKIAAPPWQEIADGVDPGQVKLRAAVDRLFNAVAQAADTASSEQQQRVVDIVNNARREVYGILGEAD